MIELFDKVKNFILGEPEEEYEEESPNLKINNVYAS